MDPTRSLIRRLAQAVAALALGAALVAPAVAQQSQNIFEVPKDTQAERQKAQPGNNAPVWREVHSGTAQYSSLPGREMGVLIQPPARFPGQERASTAGEAWRNFRNGTITFWGGIAVVAALAVVVVFYLVRGTMRLKEAPTGRLIERFTLFERTVHWTMAISFVILAVSGLTMLFGKHVVMPLMGHTLFAWLTQLLKQLHNFVGPLFIVSLVLAFLIFLKDNLPSRGDLMWFLKGGGLFTGGHVPSGRFNAGEKMWFWGGVFLLGLIVGATGLILDFPNFQQLRETMQQMHVFHVIAALLFVCAAFGHIYMGTLGVEGAYTAMREGYVDEAWAKEHHEYWYQDIKAGKVPAVRSETGRQALTRHAQHAAGGE